jgi:hypothetical protein
MGGLIVRGMDGSNGCPRALSVSKITCGWSFPSSSMVTISRHLRAGHRLAGFLQHTHGGVQGTGLLGLRFVRLLGLGLRQRGVAAPASVCSTGSLASAFVAFLVLSLLIVFFVAGMHLPRASLMLAVRRTNCLAQQGQSLTSRAGRHPGDSQRISAN